MIQKSFKDDISTLYLIPTPIGNLKDITIRALEVLKDVDYILAEDTRITGMLLKNYNISKRLLSCHKYNETKIFEKIISLLEDGNNLGLVTDRGTPLISDPGSIIVKGVIDRGFNVVALPGATAFVPALNVSGLDTDRFLFYGFLSSKESACIKELEEIKTLEYTLVFYESPHRITKTLQNMEKILGNRKIIISREITKLNEEVFRGNISQAIKYSQNIKGEIVIVLEKYNNINTEVNFDEIFNDINKLILEEGMKTKEAVSLISKENNISKNELYNKYIKEGRL